jgi:hypothetical protein
MNRSAIGWLIGTNAATIEFGVWETAAQAFHESLLQRCIPEVSKTEGS